MRVLLLNQCFHPDVMATAQQLTGLAQELAERGHEVTVITGDRGYDDPSLCYPRRETWNGIRIRRISSLGLGKASKWRRVLNFASFLIHCAFRLLVLPRFDVVVALTSPPLISVLGSLFVQLKGGRFFCWVMDLNPDEAIAAGWFKERSLAARILSGLLRYSLRHAEGVIVLDRFMKQRLRARGIPEERLSVVPPWALDAISYDEKGRRAFRERHDLSESFVVMYSGNHSPCHPLDTLLAAALRLTKNKQITFCFVGGGSEQSKVKAFAARHDLANILCLPYQPLNELSGSLSAADLHAVVMGDEFTGIIHPCKVYNVLTIGTPILYIGPEESHITDLASQCLNQNAIHDVRHGDVERVVSYIREAAAQQASLGSGDGSGLAGSFAKDALLARMTELIEANSVSRKALVANQKLTPNL